jgi:hypothetical protein
MPRQTFAHGGAILLAMERPGDERRVIVQRPNDRMLVEERQRLLRRRLMLEQLPQGSQTPGPM